MLHTRLYSINMFAKCLLTFNIIKPPHTSDSFLLYLSVRFCVYRVFLMPGIRTKVIWHANINANSNISRIVQHFCNFLATSAVFFAHIYRYTINATRRRKVQVGMVVLALVGRLCDSIHYCKWPSITAAKTEFRVAVVCLQRAREHFCEWVQCLHSGCISAWSALMAIITAASISNLMESRVHENLGSHYAPCSMGYLAKLGVHCEERAHITFPNPTSTTQLPTNLIRFIAGGWLIFLQHVFPPWNRHFIPPLAPKIIDQKSSRHRAVLRTHNGYEYGNTMEYKHARI